MFGCDMLSGVHKRLDRYSQEFGPTCIMKARGLAVAPGVCRSGG